MSGPVDHIFDADYITVDEEAPVSVHSGVRHTEHEATPGPRPAPPVMPHVTVQALPPPRRTKRLVLAPPSSVKEE